MPQRRPVSNSSGSLTLAAGPDICCCNASEL